MIFLGILFAGPTMNINGEVSIVEIPTKQQVISNSKVMINLGYYIKSYELLVLKKIIKELL